MTEHYASCMRSPHVDSAESDAASLRRMVGGLAWILSRHNHNVGNRHCMSGQCSGFIFEKQSDAQL
jgi:hypothetical protein